jgi:hypothetical protein
VDPYLHIENPIRQRMSDITAIWAHELGFTSRNAIPFEEWIQRCRDADSLGSLEDFFSNHFRDLAEGSVLLDTTKSRSISGTLRGVSSISKDLLIKYINRWRLESFID